jgi:hypothetical protein
MVLLPPTEARVIFILASTVLMQFVRKDAWYFARSAWMTAQAASALELWQCVGISFTRIAWRGGWNDAVDVLIVGGAFHVTRLIDGSEVC